MKHSENKEIERKFLVVGSAYRELAVAKHEIVQGYLSRDPERTVRIRMRDDHAFLTIKGAAKGGGYGHFEWERELERIDAEELLMMCLPGTIRKTRYVVPAPDFEGEKRCWEVDEFHGELEGRVLAEIELGTEDEPVALPEWIGEEVTGRKEYYNANMVAKQN